MKTPWEGKESDISTKAKKEVNMKTLQKVTQKQNEAFMTYVKKKQANIEDL